MSGTGNAGLGTHPPKVSIAPAPADGKRKGEFYVNDITSSLRNINKQIEAAHKVGIKLRFGMHTESGWPVLELIEAVRTE